MHPLIYPLTRCFSHSSCSSKKQCTADLSWGECDSLRTQSGGLFWPESQLCAVHLLPSCAVHHPPKKMSLESVTAGSPPQPHSSWQKFKTSNFLLRNSCKFCVWRGGTNCSLPHLPQRVARQSHLLGNSAKGTCNWVRIAGTQSTRGDRTHYQKCRKQHSQRPAVPNVPVRTEYKTQT